VGGFWGVCVCVCVWGGGGIGPEWQRGGGVPVGGAYVKTTSKKPRQANEKQPPLGFLLLQVHESRCRELAAPFR
jgi:hypothetical protein